MNELATIAQRVWERPILFTPQMAQAIAEGRKTQTRRVVKPQLSESVVSFILDNGGGFIPQHLSAKTAERWLGATIDCPYGKPGDRLVCRESVYLFGHWEKSDGLKPRKRLHRQRWRFVTDSNEVRYDAPEGFRKGRHKEDPATPAWHRRPNIHMPRWACRSVLEVVSVRVERVEDISEADAKAEGFNADIGAPINGTAASEYFLRAFYDINKPVPRWSNPWCWVVEFKKESTKS